MPHTIFARQPIFNLALDAIGYEILFRSDLKDVSEVDGDQASSTVILNLFTGADFGDIVGTKKAFINFTRHLLLEPLPANFPHQNVVIEILEHIKIDEAVIQAVYKLKKSGYQIALDDFQYAPVYQPLIEIADYIKIDVLNCRADDIKQRLEGLENYKGILLAEKIETYEQLNECKDLGFKAFQGFFLCKPQIIEGQRIETSRNIALQILARIQDDQADMHDLEELVSQDAQLSYKIFRLSNSSLFAPVRPITSIREAIFRVGLAELRNWVCLMVLSSIDCRPYEIRNLAAVRAKMCELVGKFLHSPARPSQLFIAGLFSLLDVMMHERLEALLQQVSIPEEISAGILLKQGEVGRILAAVEAYEQGQWHSLNRLQQEAYAKAYECSLKWAHEISKQISAD